MANPGTQLEADAVSGPRSSVKGNRVYASGFGSAANGHTSIHYTSIH